MQTYLIGFGQKLERECVCDHRRWFPGRIHHIKHIFEQFIVSFGEIFLRNVFEKFLEEIVNFDFGQKDDGFLEIAPSVRRILLLREARIAVDNFSTFWSVETTFSQVEAVDDLTFQAECEAVRERVV